MSNHESIYDLGEIHLDGRGSRKASDGTRTTELPRPSAGPYSAGGRTTRSSGPGPGLTGSLSLLLPGAGQIVAGETTWGLFFLTCGGLVGTVAWALVSTFERLLPTLDLLGIPRLSVIAAFGALAACGSAIHIAAANQAHAMRDDGDPDRLPHPVAAGLASAFIPGWGQLLVGHRVRGTLFLLAAWVLGLTWVAVTPGVAGVLDACGFPVPPAVRDGWGPIAMIAAPVTVWAVGIYDAVTGAANARR